MIWRTCPFIILRVGTSDIDIISIKATKIKVYFEHNKLLYDGQHGFRGKLLNYGFSNDAIRILEDYFLNRHQTKLGDIYSDLVKIMLGIPQGLMLGPLLFILYINDLLDCLVDNMLKIFADDTTLLFY